HVVRGLSERGAIFVDSVDDVPEGATLVFSAHGVAPAVRDAAGARRLTTIDATCPLVTKVHPQARPDAEGGYPNVPGAPACAEEEGICYATASRQAAVRELLREVELLLVVGSHNSSNSNRLVEVAHAWGVPAYLIDDAGEIDDAWLEGVEVVGVTSGASAPERLVQDVCNWFRGRGVPDIGEQRSVHEDVVFRVPVELRRAARPAA